MKKYLILSILFSIFSGVLFALTPEELITVSLTASGVSEENLPLYIERIDQITWNYRSFISGKSNEEAAEATLDFMYENILEKYNANTTEINEALDNGIYNCVSSSILYLYFSKIAGFPCTPIQTPNHAFCEVLINGETIRVETTNPHGFNPGTQKPSSDGNRYYIVPARNYLNKKEVSDKILIYMIYNNRVSALFKKGKNFEALPLAEANFQFLGECPESVSLLQGTATNILSSYIASKDYDQGLAFARDFASKYGLNKDGKSNAENLLTQKSWKLQDARQFEDAMNLVQSYSDLLDETTITKITKRMISNEIALVHNEFARYFNKKQFAEAKEVIKKGITILGEDKTLMNDLSYALKYCPDEAEE